MQINKINANYASNINFGKIKKTNVTENTQKNNTNNSKKLLLALGALALTGSVIVTLKNHKFEAQINKAKKALEESDTIKKAFENFSKNKKKIALGAAAVAGSGAVASAAISKDEKSEVDVLPQNENEDKLFDKKEISEISENNTPEDIEKNDESVIKAGKAVEESTKALTLEDFKKANGEFWKSEAYIGNNPYTGDIILKETGNEKIVATYEDGYLTQATTNVKVENGSFEPQKIKNYSTDRNGTTTVEIKKRKYDIDNRVDGLKLADEWYTDEIFKINDSEVTILNHTPFNDYLETHFKEQKDGSWKGYYEDRRFNTKTQKYEVVQIDAETHNVLNKRQVKKIMG
ncbi:hypothetical protein IJ182_05450 [bacterium]|nr:hypothetical protein [bacterium]